MSAEAIARLREVVTKYQSDLQFHPEFQDVEADLRALLDAHEEALDVLHSIWIARDANLTSMERERATAVLTKAGR